MVLLAESRYTGAPAGQQQCRPLLSTGGGAEGSLSLDVGRPAAAVSASVLLELKPTTGTAPGEHREFKTWTESF